MAVSSISSPSFSILNTTAVSKPVCACSFSRLPQPSRSFCLLASSFKTGSPLGFRIARKRKSECRAMPVSIRCEQGTKESKGLDVWLSRFAMIGFASAIAVEVATGKGLLENFGFLTPLPTLALVLTALVGVLTAFFIFQSASQD